MSKRYLAKQPLIIYLLIGYCLSISFASADNYQDPRARANNNDYYNNERLSDRNDNDNREKKTPKKSRGRKGNWDYKGNWRYNREAFFKGQSQAQAYREEHPYGSGGVGYDSDENWNKMRKLANARDPRNQNREDPRNPKSRYEKEDSNTIAYANYRQNNQSRNGNNQPNYGQKEQSNSNYRNNNPYGNNPYANGNNPNANRPYSNNPTYSSQQDRNNPHNGYYNNNNPSRNGYSNANSFSKETEGHYQAYRGNPYYNNQQRDNRGNPYSNPRESSEYNYYRKTPQHDSNNQDSDRY